MKTPKNGELLLRLETWTSHRRFLKEADLPESDNHVKATAMENVFVPEGNGLAAMELEKRILSSLTTYCIHGVQAEATN